MTSAEIENRIARVNATMAMEDMPLTEDQKNTLREIGQGKITFEEVLNRLIKKYTKVG